MERKKNSAGDGGDGGDVGDGVLPAGPGHVHASSHGAATDGGRDEPGGVDGAVSRER